MKQSKHFLVCLTTMLSFTGCAQMQLDWLNEQRTTFVKIKKGMTEEEVTSLIVTNHQLDTTFRLIFPT